MTLIYTDQKQFNDHFEYVNPCHPCGWRSYEES